MVGPRKSPSDTAASQKEGLTTKKMLFTGVLCNNLNMIVQVFEDKPCDE